MYKQFINGTKEINENQRKILQASQSKLEDVHRFSEKEKETENFLYKKAENPDFQKEMEVNFKSQFNSKEFVSEMQDQMKLMKMKGIKSMISEVSKFNQNESEIALKDDIARKEATKLRDAIITFSKNHLGEYNQSGILTPEGSVSPDISDFVKKEAKLASTVFSKKQDAMKIEDIDKLIDFNKILLGKK